MIRKICLYGDPVLRKHCEEVKLFDDEFKQLIRDMIDTTLQSRTGVAIAAPQIGVPLRVFVFCLWDNDAKGNPVYERPKVYANPKILSHSDEEVFYDEGCLSIPGIRAEVKRPRTILIEAQNENGTVFQEELTDFPARAFLHENDHLNGVLFLDRLPPPVRKSLYKKLQKGKR
jgi:peptide deformylase